MLKETAAWDSAAENSFTGIETMPKLRVPEARGRAGIGRG
jgi:hypothetical protein